MAPYGSLWLPMAHYGSLLFFMVIYWFQRHPVILMAPYGCLWLPVALNGSQWLIWLQISANSSIFKPYGFTWDFVGPYWSLWLPIAHYIAHMGTYGSYISLWLLSAFFGCLLVSIGCYWLRLVLFGSFWLFLATFGTFWDLLTPFCSWWILFDPNCFFWLLMVHFGTT
jgi:hypothetical protein